jgi:hypothetical protein
MKIAHRVLLGLLLAVLVTAFSAAPRSAKAAQIRPSFDQSERGFVVGDWDFVNGTQANSTIKAVKDIGSNSIRLVVRGNGKAHPEPFQLDAVCNAAQAMVSNHMSTLILNLLPRNTGWPNTDEGRNNFISTYNDFLGYLLSKPAGCALGALPDGTVAPMLSIQVMPVNEPNISTFCDAGTDDDNLRHQICADWAARLVHLVYADIQAEESGYGVQIPVIGLSLGSHHNPVGFLSAYCKSRAALGYSGTDMEYIGFHPYALQGSNDAMSGVRMTPELQAAVKACFGKAIPVKYTEVGWETTSPADKGYTCSTPSSVLQVDPASYPALEVQMSRLATKYVVQGIYNFLLVDEQCLNPGWQSGMYYWDGSPKPFLSAIQALQALLGNPPDS